MRPPADDLRAELPDLRYASRAVGHDSAAKHAGGTATYIDDIREPEGTLHVVPAGAPAAHGRLVALDLAAVQAAPGVVAALTAADIPGNNDISPVGADDDPLLTADTVHFHGQPMFVVVARTRVEARRAARLAKATVEPLPAVLTVDEAIAAGTKLMDDFAIARGDPAHAIAEAAHRLDGRLYIGGQEHFYLEGQAALAIPGEDGDMFVASSTQHPSEVQKAVAHVLGVPANAVTCEVRRMGGAFGGKESQAAQWAALAALAARATGRPCKLRLDRDDDMAMTGKRHDFRVDWRVGFDDDGSIAGLEFDFHARCGFSTDLSSSVVDRTVFHADNAYFVANMAARSYRYRTNTVSNTAFRGFGGPQGILAVEHVMDRIAHRLKLDPLDVRRRNLYGPGRDTTHYGMTVFDNIAPEIVGRLAETSEYARRRAEIAAFNRAGGILRRGIALTPVKFGISFTATHLNQAGALVHVYTDGSVHLNHGGTEMGQGLFVKVQQVVADEFGIDLDRVKITATTTAKVPNTAPTAASSGSDLNAMAARNAARQVRDRLAGFAADRYGCDAAGVSFRDNAVYAANHAVAFGELAAAAFMARVPLSSTGFYATPRITWDRAKGTGRPFFYFAYGAACSEVSVDTLTGETKVERIDILHDAGRSLNPAVDIGQIEGGFVQGMGWLTGEELVFDAEGRLATHAPSTYKIPTGTDVPGAFNIELYEGDNREETIHRSKAVGEPPLMLAVSVHAAILDALAGLAAPGDPVPLNAPATPEAVLRAVCAMRGETWGAR